MSICECFLFGCISVFLAKHVAAVHSSMVISRSDSLMDALATSNELSVAVVLKEVDALLKLLKLF